MDPLTDKRGSPRTPAKVVIIVEGRDVDLKPVREETYTLLINTAGALLPLAASFKLNDNVRVVNKATGTRTDGRIAWRSAEPLNGRWSYGIALLDPPEDFWGPKKN